MVNLTLTYKNYACKKFINAGYPDIVPIIYSTTSYFNFVTNSKVIIIHGDNFKDYSTLRFGNIETDFVFISSQQIEFYIPSIYSYGVYPIQLWNGFTASNKYIHYNV